MSTVKFNPNEKTALVSGANRGIGRAIVVELLEKGARKVYAGARNVDSLASLQETYGDRLVPLALDVTNPATIALAAAQVEDLDLLVNNAGVLVFGSVLAENAEESLKQNLDVNVFGVINLSNAMADKLKKESETAIVNISSMAGLGNMPMLGTYSVSKAAVHSITQGIRAEMAPHNTLVTGVYPGPIKTDMTVGFDMEMDTPQNVAQSIVQGLSDGTEDVYPDMMSREAGTYYASSPKGIEQQFAAFG